jgi:Ser/Thr protein kinase RdoA (MazF antagonist)
MVDLRSIILIFFFTYKDQGELINMEILSTHHSIPSTEFITNFVTRNYNLESEIINCKLIHFGVNDTFVIYTANNSYIIRVYRNGWRTDSEILCELDYLLHLHKREFLVSTPISNQNGDYLLHILAPEGIRQVVMFMYAPGTSLRIENTLHSSMFGSSCAILHKKSIDFKSSHSRFSLDRDHLLLQPLHQIKHFWKSETINELIWLEKIVHTLLNKIPFESLNLERTMCHGDLHGGNVHIKEETLTHFDFDCAGFGYRVYDLSVFLWTNVTRRSEREYNWGRWRAFIDSYEQINPLTRDEKEVIPLFVVMREIWLLGMQAEVSQIRGASWYIPIFYKSIKFLNDWIYNYDLLTKYPSKVAVDNFC